jgi:hypothetical protein
MQMAWRRMVLHSIRIYVDILMQSAADYLVSRNQGTIVTSVPQAAKQSKKDAQTETKVRRGIGRPLPRSTASKEWQFEPSACVHSEDLLRQRGSKNNFWWTCLGCGSRWQRLEWEMDQQENSKGRAGSSTDPAKSPQKTLQTSSSVAYPARLPPPRSRPDLKALLIQDPGALSCVSPTVPLPMEEMMDEVDKSPMTAAERMTQGPITPAKTKLTADQLLEQQLLKNAREKESRKKMSSGVILAQPRARARASQPSAGNAETHVLNSSEEEQEQLAIADFAMVNQP